MSSLKESILKLRAEGKSYRQIEKELGCSKSTISYHLSDGQKEKTIQRMKKLRKSNPLLQKVDSFKSNLRVNTYFFQKKSKGAKRDMDQPVHFTYKDVLEKFGENTSCYLSGQEINLMEDTNYHLDHILPVSRGGDNSLDNMGITREEVNHMKRDLTVNELLEWCQKILEHNGFEVSKK